MNNESVKVYLQRKRGSACRCGITFLEVLGCMVAMVGGVFLGAAYLGVDVKDMAIAGLRQSGLLEARNDRAPHAAVATLPTPTSPALPATHTPAPLAAVQPPTARTQAAAARAAAIGTKRQENLLASVPATAPTAEVSKANSSETTATTLTGPAAGLASQLISPEDLVSLTDDQRRLMTETYWEELGLYMKQEVEHRLASVRDSGNWQLFDYLSGRKLGHQEAAAAIGRLKPRGVDPHVLAYAKKARAWHEAGVNLFGRALDLLTDAPTAQLSGPFAQSWQSASTQHRMEERLLAQKHAAVAAYLEHSRQGLATAASPAN